MLPPFDENGCLPRGVHPCSCNYFRERFSYNSRRFTLLVGFLTLAEMLARVGCTQIWVGGSFVTEKEFPNDFDGCFDSMEIDWYSPDLDLIIADPQAQAIKFGGILIADAMSAYQQFFQTDRQSQPRGIVLLNPQELL
jgi:hypothetical protein